MGGWPPFRPLYVLVMTRRLPRSMAAAEAALPSFFEGAVGMTAAERERAAVVEALPLMVSARVMVPFFPPDLERSWRSCCFEGFWLVCWGW